jgi:molybdopterin-guanine dinucleotide biosynthesis protein A
VAEPLAASAVVLAGGQSSRMGTNKALMDFGGEPLVSRLVRRFQAWFAEVWLVTNEPARYAFLGVPMVPDRLPGLGPLAGLEAGLSACRYDLAFFCACDMPFVSEDFVRYLVAQAPGYDIVVPRLGGHLEPMHALYRRSLLPAATAALEARRLKLLTIYAAARVRVVDEPEIRRFGDPRRLLFNCNAPADVAQALAWERET